MTSSPDLDNGIAAGHGGFPWHGLPIIPLTPGKGSTPMVQPAYERLKQISGGSCLFRLRCSRTKVALLRFAAPDDLRCTAANALEHRIARPEQLRLALLEHQQAIQLG